MAEEIRARATNMDTAYVERANGRYEAWTYSEGQRVMVARWYGSRDALARTLRAEGYTTVFVKEAGNG